MFTTRTPVIALVAALGLTAGCSSNGSGDLDPTFVTTVGAGIGAIGGGVAGSLIGGGTGKTVATGAGAVIGGATGAAAARAYVNNQQQTVSAPVQQQYQAPVQPQYQQPAPAYQTSVPTVQAPQYQAPQYQTPQYQTPVATAYQAAPSMQTQAQGSNLVYIDPVAATPTSLSVQPVSTGVTQTYAAPSLTTPSYTTPSYTTPSLSAPSVSVPSQVNQYSTAIRSAAEAPVLQGGPVLSAPTPSYTIQSAPSVPSYTIPSTQF